MKLSQTFLFLNIFFSPTYTFASEQGIDYDQLSHQLKVQSIRAGQHDPSGLNQYILTIQLSAVFEIDKASKEELGETQNIGTIEMESLTILNDTNKLIQKMNLMIEGKQIRQLVAKVMASHQIKEDQIKILGNIKLYENAKKFFYFGDHQLILKKTYPILPDLSESQVKEIKLSEKDEKGAILNMLITLDPKKSK